MLLYRSSLKQIIEKRIGLETFTDKLTKVMKHESYTRAAKKPNLNYRQPNDIIFDFEFTRTFKILESEYVTVDYKYLYKTITVNHLSNSIRLIYKSSSFIGVGYYKLD